MEKIEKMTTMEFKELQMVSLKACELVILGLQAYHELVSQLIARYGASENKLIIDDLEYCKSYLKELIHQMRPLPNQMNSFQASQYDEMKELIESVASYASNEVIEMSVLTLDSGVESVFDMSKEESKIDKAKTMSIRFTELTYCITLNKLKEANDNVEALVLIVDALQKELLN